MKRKLFYFVMLMCSAGITLCSLYKGEYINTMSGFVLMLLWSDNIRKIVKW